MNAALRLKRSGTGLTWAATTEEVMVHDPANEISKERWFMRSKIELGKIAGGRADENRFECTRYATRIYEDGTREKGFAVRARWMDDGEVCFEHWFEWRTGVLK